MSTENMVFTAIGLIALAVVVYFILRYMKGSIKIQLDKTSFAAGETIKGNFRLIARQAIEANKLTIALIADEVIKRKDNDGKDITDTNEVYRDEQVIEGKYLYEKGFDNTHSFELLVPASGESSMDSSKLGQALNTLGSMMDMNRRYLEWSIEVCLDAKGIDLIDSEDVYVK
ncbi:MAG: arrestin family protein [Colwellia sp.]